MNVHFYSLLHVLNKPVQFSFCLINCPVTHIEFRDIIYYNHAEIFFIQV